MKIGITIGDINGIGIEVILKSVFNKKVLEICTPIIYGSSKVISYHKNIINGSDFHFSVCSSAEKAQKGKVNVVNCWDEVVNISLGQATPEGGKYAHIALDRATQEAKKGHLDAIVTAPINKSVMDSNAFPFTGHTEYFSYEFKVKESLMTMISDSLRIALVTNHLPISEVAQNITKENVESKLTIFETSIREDFGIHKPTIAILGLNPHAGDNGKIGEEDMDIIRPVIIGAKKSGKLIVGPYAADGFFGSGAFRKVDGILAMFHDQGLVPFKTLTFGGGVNFTAGLPIVRTSPDHGTTYDLAGKNQADASSMREALYAAIDISRTRKDYKEMTANPLVKKPKRSEEVEE